MQETTGVFAELRAEAQALLDREASAGVVAVDAAALDRLAAGPISAREVKEKAERVTLPLKFSSPLEELNFHAVAALLGFGAAYEGGRPHLAESAKDTILFGLIGLHLTKADLHAGFLHTASRADVSSYFGIDPMESVPHESIPAIHIERPGSLSAYVDALVQAMNGTGQRLRELDAPDLARFILAAIRSGTEGAGGGRPTAARLVQALAAAFPATFGEALPGGAGAAFVPHKKALLLAGECYHRLRAEFPEFEFADFAAAPGYATPAVITHLCRLGVIRKPGSDQEDEAAGGQLLLGADGGGKHVAALAAAAVVALDGLAARLSGGEDGTVAPLDLAYYLDEVYGKQQEQQQQQAAEEEQQQQQGQQQQEDEQEGAANQKEEAAPAPAKFVPPRDQTVM